MTALDANPDDTAAAAAEAPATPVIGPMAGDPSMLGLASFIAGSVALGLGLVGVVPFGVLGAPVAIILAATALGLLMATVWCAALGQSAVAAVFGIFGTFWLSYAVLVLGLDHNWFAIPVTAALATVKLFLATWLVIIIMLTLATLRLPSAFTAVFGRAVQRPAEDRRLRGPGLRRARHVPVRRRGRGRDRRQGPAARQAPDALGEKTKTLFPERAVVAAPVTPPAATAR